MATLLVIKIILLTYQAFISKIYYLELCHIILLPIPMRETETKT